MTDSRLVLRGEAVAHADGRRVEVHRLDHNGLRRVGRFEVEVDVTRLDVASDGSTVIVGDRDRAWLWSAAAGYRPLAVRSGTRDQFAASFVGTGEPLVLLSQSGLLRGLSADGAQRFTAELRSPRSFYCHRFVDLPGGRIAILGNEFSDPLETIITVAGDDLATNSGAVQAALAARCPVSDRARRVTVGRAPGDAAIVWRDPDIEEPHDPDELPDVWGFSGFYLRDLVTGGLIQRIPHRGPFPSGTPIAATDRVIAIERPGRIDFMDRRSARVDCVTGRAVTLDRCGVRALRLDDDGHLEVINLQDRFAQ